MLSESSGSALETAWMSVTPRHQPGRYLFFCLLIGSLVSLAPLSHRHPSSALAQSSSPKEGAEFKADRATGQQRSI